MVALNLLNLLIGYTSFVIMLFNIKFERRKLVFIAHVKCGIILNVNSVDILMERIFRLGFRPQYHVWVLHGEDGVYKEKSVVEDVNNVDVNEDVDRVDGYETDEENFDEDVDYVDEMREGVEDELAKRPRLKSFLRFLSFFGTYSLKVVKTWFVWHETWHTSLFCIYYCIELIRIENNSHMLKITC